MKNKNKLLEGSILKSLLVLSIPIIFANILQTAYQLIDTFWVGRLGSVAVAAVSVSFPILFFLISAGMGLTIAGAILVAQYKGKKSNKDINHVSSQTILLIFVISIIISVIGFIFTPFLVKLIGVNSNVFKEAVSYLRVSFIGTIFMFLYMAFQSLMRGVGEVKIPMYIVLGTVILNLFLDPLFIFGFSFIPASGVSGAAVASVITQALSAIIGIWILFKGKHGIKIKLNHFKPDFKLLKKIFRIGFPASIDQSARALGMVVMTIIVATFGAITIAAYGIGTRLISFVIIPALGLSMATSTLVGQNIGSKNLERAKKTIKLSERLGFVTLTSVGIIFFIFAKAISTFFIPGQADVIQQSTLFIKIISLSFGFVGLQMTYSGVFRGSGLTSLSMFITLITVWVLRIPIAYLLSINLGNIGIWLSYLIANVVGYVVVLPWYKSGSWMHKKVIEN